jgi:putative DNA primase/helicase
MACPSDLRAAARALGGEVAGGEILCPGPSHGPRDRSLSVKLSASAPDGFLVHSFAGDPWQDCRGRNRALALWRASGDPRGTLAERYLASRKLDLDTDLAGNVLRWHPGIGAMLALFRDIRTDEPRAICRTFLDHEGRKIERKFLGPVGGCAIMLDGLDIVLHVGEGVETCMAARQLGLRPTWALGSAGAVAAFPVLGGVDRLNLLQENDDASERACEACAARWYAAGREVFFKQPKRGKDANDALMLMGSSRHDR